MFFLRMAWKGMDQDQSIWWSANLEGTSWQAQASIPDISTVDRPALAVFDNINVGGSTLYMAWLGEGDRLYLSYYDGSNANWISQPPINPNPLMGTAYNGPALASFNGALYAVWRGPIWDIFRGLPPQGVTVINDQTLYWSRFDGTTWGPTQNGPGWSSTGPALAVFNGALYMAWKGMDQDQRIWWSSFDGNSWAPQQYIIDERGTTIGTSDRPALAVFNGVLYMAWKGIEGDQRLWWSSSNGSGWTPQQQGPGWSSSGPALAPFGGFFPGLYMAWKGMNQDQRLWWSSSDGNSWAPQQIGPGASSTGPTLAYW